MWTHFYDGIILPRDQVRQRIGVVGELAAGGELHLDVAPELLVRIDLIHELDEVFEALELGLVSQVVHEYLGNSAFLIAKPIFETESLSEPEVRIIVSEALRVQAAVVEGVGVILLSEEGR